MLLDAKILRQLQENEPYLTKLDLYENSLSSTDIQTLATALSMNRTLTSLNLYECQLGDAGGQTLATALNTNRTLTTLNLSDNQLGAAGAQALAEALNTNRTLTTLDLGDNQLGDVGIQVLTKAIATNYTLVKLTLSKEDIQLHEEDFNRLQSRLETNKTIAREKNPIQKANRIRNATALPYEVPTLIDIGIFAVGKGKSKEQIEALPPLPAELNEKIFAHFFPT